jgi:SAM-dependent methyltransferase
MQEDVTGDSPGTETDAIVAGFAAEDWQGRYDAGQTGWDRGGANPALLRWLNGPLLPPSSVLVPGCGRGHEVVELASRGFDVTAVDIARTPVRELTNRLISSRLIAEVLREDVLRLKPNKPFDVVYEHTFLCELNHQRWSHYEDLLSRCLRPGGRLLALFMQTDGRDGPPFHCGLGEMRELFHERRWAWPADSFRVDHPAGMHELALVLTRRGNG